MKPSSLKVLKAIHEGGHVSFDRFTKKWRLVPKKDHPTFVTNETVAGLIASGHLRKAEPRYGEGGTHYVTELGKQALDLAAQKTAAAAARRGRGTP